MTRGARRGTRDWDFDPVDGPRPRLGLVEKHLVNFSQD
jgi:hypothetical protein